MSEQYPALRYSDNMWEDYKNGVLSVECDSWKEFESRVEEYSSKYKYVWRGQSCEKPLLPSIYRGHNTPDNRSIDEILKQFRKDIPGSDALEGFFELLKKERPTGFEQNLSNYINMRHPKRDNKDTEDSYVNDFIDNIFWAIGQHHGLKTPLLDWTRDPYTALFFAICERKEKDDKRVVFGLAIKSRRLLDKRKKRYIEFLTNLNFVERYLPSNIHFPDIPTDVKYEIIQMFRRIKEQAGVFTRTLHNHDIEGYANKCYIEFKKKEKKEFVFLIKILLPNNVRKDFLEKLEEKEITYKKMYPDVLGAALHCNLKLYL